MFFLESSQMLLFGKPVTYYVVLPIIAALVSTAVCTVMAHHLKGDSSLVFRCCIIISMVGAFGQIFIGYVPKFMLPFTFLLMEFGVLLAFTVIGKLRNQKEIMQRASVITCAVYIGAAKLGCFLTGCCYGRAYGGHLSVTYGENTLCRVKNVPLFPAQLVTAVALLGLAVVFAVLLFRKGTKNINFLLSLITMLVYYSCIQLIVPPANQMILNGIDFSKIISAATAVAVVADVIYIIAHNRNNKGRKSE